MLVSVLKSQLIFCLRHSLGILVASKTVGENSFTIDSSGELVLKAKSWPVELKLNSQWLRDHCRLLHLKGQMDTKACGNRNGCGEMFLKARGNIIMEIK